MSNSISRMVSAAIASIPQTTPVWLLVEHELPLTTLDEIIDLISVVPYEVATDRGTLAETEIIFAGEGVLFRLDPLLESDELSEIRREGRAVVETGIDRVWLDVIPVEFLPDGTVIVETFLNY